jgi:hypothetical protein
MGELLSGDEVELLARALDLLVPACDDGRLPGAGALGLAEFLERAAAGDPELRDALAEVMARLAAEGFAELEPVARVARLQALAGAAPGAFRQLVVHTYRGYYCHPRVTEALGLEARPPFPRGYSVPPTDFSILDPVRRRGKLYREC